MAHNYHVKFVKGIVQNGSSGQNRFNPFGQSEFPRWTEFNQTCMRMRPVMESVFSFLVPVFLCCVVMLVQESQFAEVYSEVKWRQ